MLKKKGRDLFFPKKGFVQRAWSCHHLLGASKLRINLPTAPLNYLLLSNAERYTVCADINIAGKTYVCKMFVMGMPGDWHAELVSFWWGECYAFSKKKNLKIIKIEREKKKRRKSTTCFSDLEPEKLNCDSQKTEKKNFLPKS